MRSGDVDAVILVGGLGSRLRPLTLSAPKPMLPTAGVPFLTHLIARLREAGITHVVLGTSYHPEIFATYFGDGRPLGVEMECVVEAEPLGTGGGIRNVADRLRSETVLICNGDNLIGVDIAGLVDGHTARDADVTLCLTRVSDPRRYGCVPTDADGRVQAFLEKDPNPVTDQINAGMYVFRREVIDTIPTGRPVSVERETFPGLLAAGARVYGVVQRGYWRDFGTPADFVEGSADLVRGIAPSPAVREPADLLVLPGGRVDESAKVRGGTTVGHDAVVESSVIGDRASIGARVELLAGARVWPDVTLADGAIRFSSDV